MSKGFRIAHLSDLHLGYRATRKVDENGVNVREMDGYTAFQELVDSVLAHDVDVVIVAGDIFHTPTPSVRSVLFAQEQFRRLADAGIRVYMLAGNHDTKDVRSDIAASKLLDDRDRGIFSDVEPLAVHRIHDDITLHMISHHAYTEQGDTMNRISTENGINILSTHGSVIDPITSMRLKTEDSPREIVIPDTTLYDHGWDYVLLGHIHERGWIEPVSKGDAPGVFYNGSLIRRGFADKECPLGRGWTQWDIDSEGNFTSTIHTVHQRTQHDLDPIDASVLSSAEITERMVEQLRGTQSSLDAPILRQRIVNITPAKRNGIDWKIIDHESSHALDWKTVFESVSTTTEKKKRASDTEHEANLLNAYDAWEKDSRALQDVDKHNRPVVAQSAKNLIQKELEEELESEKV